jgi:hypothetical protein
MSVPAGTTQTTVLDQSVQGGNLLVRVAFWIVPPANRIVVPLGNVTSQVPGSTPLELSYLESGQLVEQVQTVTMAAANQTLASVQATLRAAYNTAQDAYAAAVSSITNLVGSSDNGTTWTAGP